MPSTTTEFLSAYKAEDLGDLLNHIGWVEVLRPALVQERDMFSRLLVGATLGTPVRMETRTGPAELTKEQLAGKIYGIDYIIDTIEKILARGDRAVEHLRKFGINLSKESHV